MTREEAIVQIESLKNYCEYMADGDESGAYVYDLDEQALDLALTALRPVSREQVEKAWKGEWETTIDAGCEVYMCSACGARDVKELYEYENPRRFCYHCGAPMTDEAVDMMMERINKMEETGNGLG